MTAELGVLRGELVLDTSGWVKAFDVAKDKAKQVEKQITASTNALRTSVNNAGKSLDASLKKTNKQAHVTAQAFKSTITQFSDTVKSSFDGLASSAKTSSNAIANSANKTKRAIKQVSDQTMQVASQAGAKYNTFKTAMLSANTKLIASFKWLKSAIFSIRGAILAMGLGLLGKSLIDTGLLLDRTVKRFRVLSGDLIGAKKHYADVAKMSDKYALSLRSTVEEYSKFMIATRGTALAGKEAKNIFDGFSQGIAAMGLSASQSEQVFRALIQMISKGKVQTEELRRQLAEVLPGAYKIAADSVGVTVAALDKFISTGKVLPEDLIPAMAESMKKIFGPQAMKNIDTLQGKINLMANAWLKLKKAVMDFGGNTFVKFMADFGKSSMDSLSSGITSVGNNFDVVRKDFIQWGKESTKAFNANKLKEYNISIQQITKTIQRYQTIIKSDKNDGIKKSASYRMIELNKQLKMYQKSKTAILKQMSTPFKIQQSKAEKVKKEGETDFQKKIELAKQLEIKEKAFKLAVKMQAVEATALDKINAKILLQQKHLKMAGKLKGFTVDEAKTKLMILKLEKEKEQILYKISGRKEADKLNANAIEEAKRQVQATQTREQAIKQEILSLELSRQLMENGKRAISDEAIKIAQSKLDNELVKIKTIEMQKQQRLAKQALDKEFELVDKKAKKVQTIINMTKTQKQKYQENIDLLKEMVGVKDRLGKEFYSEEQIKVAVAQLEKLRDKTKDINNEQSRLGKEWTKITKQWKQGLEDAFMDAVETGKLSFKSLFKQIALDIVKMNAVKPLTNMIGGWFGLPTKHTGGIAGEAPKFHNGGVAPRATQSKGLASKEVVSILQQGEAIFTGKQQQAITDALAGGGNNGISLNIGSVVLEGGGSSDKKQASQFASQFAKQVISIVSDARKRGRL